MEVSEDDVARIPASNLRASLSDFAEFWSTAETLNRGQTNDGTTDWYLGGIVITCRWLANADARSPGARASTPRSPVTGRQEAAYEELIEAEYLAAEQLLETRPDLVTDRPGWCEGIQSTLRWAWRAEGPRPIDIGATSTGRPPKSPI